jgi:dTDP-4-dehydrorhamnose 3,5-epimerase
VRVRATSINGSWIFTPTLHEDDRGVFLESFTQAAFLGATNHPLHLKQGNVSESSRGTIRGIHFADIPPGQAKYVQCYAGRILDVVVDIRVGSPTFRQWEAVELNSESRQALYIAEGLGHAFCALSESATVGYMCSEPYAPTREHGIHPLDPDLGISWPTDLDIQLSPKDASAPSLSEAVASGLLPQWAACQEFYASLRRN